MRGAMSSYLPLVFRNVWRNRRRSLLTLASVAVCGCARLAGAFETVADIESNEDRELREAVHGIARLLADQILRAGRLKPTSATTQPDPHVGWKNSVFMARIGSPPRRQYGSARGCSGRFPTSGAA